MRRIRNRKGRSSTFELLEDRRVLATFTVTNLLDAGVGSLRDAIEQSNQLAGHDEVAFDAGLAGRIELTSGILELTDDVTIDGSSAAIEIDGQESSRLLSVSSTSTVAINDITFARAFSAGRGGAILNDGQLELSDVTLVDNVALSGAGIANSATGTLTINQSTFRNNDAAQQGGAIENNGGIVIISDSLFSANSATNDEFAEAVGGAIFSLGATGSLDVTGSEFRENLALRSGDSGDGRGGAIFVRSQLATIRDSHFAMNNSERGGAIFGWRSTLNISDSIIENNFAAASGGGVYFFMSSGEVVDSIVRENRTIRGGGGIVNFTQINGSGSFSLHILRSQINDNRSSGSGGGILDLSGAPNSIRQITETTIDGNDTSWDGGGIYVEANSPMEIRRSTISNNSARDGGGLWLLDESGPAASSFEMWNSTISGNSADRDGGGVFSDGSSFIGSPQFTFQSTTVTNNQAVRNGGGVYFEWPRSSPDFFQFHNSIVANNLADSTPSDFVSPDTPADYTFSYSLIGNSSGSFLRNFSSGGPNQNLIGGESPADSIDPLLSPLGDHGGPTLTHRPLAESPVIDRGINAGSPMIDQTGAPRRFGSRVDMGSVEFAEVRLVDADFNDDNLLDCSDVDALVAMIAGGTDDALFDLTGDGFVNIDDLDAWLAEAGNANLGVSTYLRGDANLDGLVDISDYNIWNRNKFTSTAAWCSADFDANGNVDVGDFNLWNANKFSSASRSIATNHGVTSVESTQAESSRDRIVERLFAEPMV